VTAGTPPSDAPAWLDEVPLRPGPPWLTMGTHALDLRRWLLVDDRRGAELALKALLLAERHGEVVSALPGSEVAAAELEEVVRAWLDGHRPDLEPPGVPQEVHPIDHPIDAAGRLVQEDLCVVEEREIEGGPAWVLAAASVCFPSHWRIGDKLGRSIAEIHAPVPHYDDELRARVDTFFSRLRADRPVWRRNLSIHAHDDLFRPEPHESPGAFPPAPTPHLDGVWLRSEYQTLRRLPRSGAVAFTIRTQVCPGRVLERRPDVAAALGARLRSITRERSALGERAPFPQWLPDHLADAAVPRS
jgi:dimethylamine monooxygenase subunit A